MLIGELMNNDKLMEQFESSFEQMKQELGFKTTLKELDEIFFLKDYISRVQFVSLTLSRDICGRISETFSMWLSQFHEWVMPNPASMIRNSEGSIFTDEEKNEMMNLMKKIRVLSSKNGIVGLTKNKKSEAEYIDEAVKLWDELKPLMLKYNKKVHNYWVESLNKPNNK